MQKKSLLLAGALVLAALISPLSVFAATKATALICVGVYSETTDGTISSKVGSGPWKPILAGDKVPLSAQLRINVDRDWIELIADNDPDTVYMIEGPESGEKIYAATDILKLKSKHVSFPKKSAGTDARFKNKLVVAQLTGRQIYQANADSDEQDLHYGDLLDIRGHVRIIGINNNLIVTFPNGATTTIVGPLSFDVKKVFDGSNLYKYLNSGK